MSMHSQNDTLLMQKSKSSLTLHNVLAMKSISGVILRRSFSKIEKYYFVS